MKTRINISLEEDTAIAIRELAERSHRTVSQWITDKVWSEYDIKKLGRSDTMLAYNENGELAEYNVSIGTKECPKCHKRYDQTIEEQVPGFRDVSYDTCPYCGAVNDRSMEVDYINKKIDE